MTVHTPPPLEIPAQVPDLSGQPRSNDRVFFAPPPPEIGALYRAESSLKVGKREMSVGVRLIILFLAMSPGFALMFMGVAQLLNPGGQDAFFGLGIFGCIITLLGLAIGWKMTSFGAHCAYVGELGAIRYRLSGRLDNKPKVQYLPFNTAAELRTSSTRHYYNGIYTGTSYNYRWTNPAGKTVFTLSGRHNSKNGMPKAGDAFHFANAAEIAWSTYLLNRADAELAQTGALRFNLDSKRWVIVGPGFIEFHFGGRVDRCEAHDIKSIGLSQGTFSIQHKDAKWYSFKGKFSFGYGTMANARLFLLVLDRFLPPSTWAK